MKKADRKIWLIVAVFVISALMGYLAARLNGNDRDLPDQSISSSMTADDEEFGKKIIFDGEEYSLRRDLTTVLFIGTDNGEDETSSTDVGTGPRADVLILFVIDESEKSITRINISRDTIIPVDVYDRKGAYINTAPMQINMQYTYGESRLRSNYLQKKKVGELMYGMKVDEVIALSMDGIAPLAELIGGVDLTFEEDMTYIDSSYLKGETVHLDGKALERIVRYRDTEVSGSNETRMERTGWIITELMKSVRSSDKKAIAEKILEDDERYITHDLSAETIKKLMTYSGGETVSVPGEVKEGELHDEFHVDDKELKELIIRLFYERA